MPSLRIKNASEAARIAVPMDATVLEALLAAGLRLRAACGGIGECGLCRIRVEAGDLNDPTTTERCQLSTAELDQGLRLACQVKPSGDMRVSFESVAPAPGWTSLAEIDGTTPVADTQSKHALGVAVDLGTSQIRVAIRDLTTGARRAGCCGPNPQVAFGSDVLTRLMYATTSVKCARELGWLARGAIGDALADLATHTAIRLQDIRQVVIVGNTAMLCLLAGKHQGLLLQPEYGTRAIDCTPDETVSWNAAWGLDPTANVHLVPPVAGFVGSDFLAAVSATRLTAGATNSLLVDFGANSEIGLWDGQTLWSASAPGGPAFEGAGISCGMAAKPGAIHRVERTDAPGQYRVEVIGGGAPLGICGSGLVDAVACLLAEGTLGPTGRFTRPCGAEGVPVTGGPKQLTLRQHDIDVFQRAKSATAAGIACVLARARLAPGDLWRVCVCGTFGRFLDVAQAQAVGLLPAVPAGCVELHEHAALHGCESLLLAPESAAAIASLREITTIVSLSEDSGFEKTFIEQLQFRPMPAGQKEVA